MQQVEQTVAGAGWLDNSPDGIDIVDLNGIVPTVENTSSQ